MYVPLLEIILARATRPAAGGEKPKISLAGVLACMPCDVAKRRERANARTADVLLLHRPGATQSCRRAART